MVSVKEKPRYAVAIESRPGVKGSCAGTRMVSGVFTTRPSRLALDSSKGESSDGTGPTTVPKGGLAIMLGGDRDGT